MSNNDFWHRLAILVPEASEVDNTSQFAAFLAGLEPDSNRTWRSLGEDAIRSGNVRAAAEIYRYYIDNVMNKRTQKKAAPTNTQKFEFTSARDYERETMRTIKLMPQGPAREEELNRINREFQRALRAGAIKDAYR